MAEQDLQGEVSTLNLLNPRQRELVETDIENLERALYGGKAMRYGGSDPSAQGYVPGDDALEAEAAGFLGRTPPNLPEPELMRHNLGADRRTLQLGTAPEYSGHRKNLLYKMYKQAVETYKDGLLSHGQMWDANIANIHHHIRHEETNRNRGKFIANMRKIFEPQEDDFSLDELRPHDPIRINSAAFRKHFDEVQWTEDDDVERMVGELDHETYYAFLELKAQTQDSSIIMTKLLIDRATYEACEARLAAKHRDLGAEDQDTPGVPEDVSEAHIEAIVEHVVVNPGLKFRDLQKAFAFKQHAMQSHEFAKALKAAVAVGFIEKDAERGYVLAEDLKQADEAQVAAQTLS